MELKVFCEAHQPSYSNSCAAGLDLRLWTEETLELKPGEHALLKTGVHMEIPSHYFGLVAVRSGLGARGLILSNGIGVIDEDYRGEIRIPVFNHGKETFLLQDGERIAQLILVPYQQGGLQFVQSEEELAFSKRGKDGFGSSGRF